MTLPAYARQRSSGIDWLGDIPAHWEIKRLKRLGSAIIGLTYDPADVVGESDGTLVLRSSNVQDGRLSLLDNVYVSTKIPETLRTRPGDILICSRNGSRALIGKNAVIGESHAGVSFGAFMTVFRSPQNAYLRHVFNSYLFVSQSSSFLSSTINQLTVGNLLGMQVPVPPPAEQVAIAAFLDNETAKIDALVEDQRWLIELLKEKRRAVISHAVTKGLNANAPMKITDVEWLGEVPEHWRVVAVKRNCVLITDGAHVSPETEGGIYPFISTKDVREEGIDFEGSLTTSARSYDSLVRSGCQPEVGDVLFSKDGTIGRTAVVRDGRKFVVASSLIIIRPDQSRLLPDFLSYLCQSAFVVEQVKSFVKGAGLPRLSIQNLLRIVGVVPPISEQRHIVATLDGEASRFASLIAEANKAIDLLKERRSALISAAVTGKIDVREPVKEPALADL